MTTILADGTAFTIAAILLLLVLSGFFSGSETALTAASRAQLRAMSDRGTRGADAALRLMEDREKLIGAILLGNNFVNILATSLASAVMTRIFVDGGVIWATLIMTTLVLIFAEVLPKTYAIAHAETMARAVAPIIAIVVIVLTPIVAVVRFIVKSILSLFGQSGPVNLEAVAREEIAGTIQLHHYEGGVEKQDRDRLLGALDLKDRDVEEIMKHRSDIELVNKDDAPNDILNQVLASAYTRLPIYDGEQENIVGVLHAKDLLREVNRLLRANGNRAGLANLDILSIASDPYFVPETTSLDDQMHSFLERKQHFALVIDEYGALEGLITLEDILEEIVGEIADEHDEEEKVEHERREDGAYILDGGMTIRDANRAFDWRLPDDEANTIAGLILHQSQSIPTPGQKFSYFDFRFEILERERNRITKIAVTPL